MTVGRSYMLYQHSYTNKPSARYKSGHSVRAGAHHISLIERHLTYRMTCLQKASSYILILCRNHVYLDRRLIPFRRLPARPADQSDTLYEETDGSIPEPSCKRDTNNVGVTSLKKNKENSPTKAQNWTAVDIFLDVFH